MFKVGIQSPLYKKKKVHFTDKEAGEDTAIGKVIQKGGLLTLQPTVELTEFIQPVTSQVSLLILLVSDTLKPLESHVHSQQIFILCCFSLPRPVWDLRFN